MSNAGLEDTFPEIGVRRFGHVNWLGVRTLYWKEVHRFLKVGGQTVLAPAVNSMLFLAIFTLALGAFRADVDGIPYATFMAPGLIMMTVLQQSFQNTASSLLIAKVQGNVVDYLMPPLSAAELAVCFTLGGVTRGLICAMVTAVAMMFFVDFPISHIWAIVFFSAGAAVILSLVGLIAAIWADKFDQMATITNFVIVPLSLLSGTFYSIRVLPDHWAQLAHWNPFFYFIDGFRYGFTGKHDSSLLIGAAFIIVLSAILGVIVYILLKRGYRLKA